jgi:hypothetical protein
MRRKLLTRDSGDHKPAVRLTDRDLSIIEAVYEHRALTTPQIQRLLFPAGQGRSERGRLVHCQHRLKLLYHNGYLTRDERPTKLSQGREALVYFLDSLGAKLLASYRKVDMSELDWRPRDNIAGANHLFIDHLLHTNDVRISLTRAATADGWEVARYIDDRDLRRKEMKEYVQLPGESERVAIVPDGFLSLQRDKDTFHHFLEVDLRTVVGLSSKTGRRDWSRKVRAYLEYYQSGRYATRYSAKIFRVLTVTTGVTRLQNLQEITEDVGGKNLFWFTTLEKIAAMRSLREPIWSVAGRDGLSHLVS